MAGPIARTIQASLQPMPIKMSQQKEGKKLLLSPRNGMTEKESSIMFVGICLAAVVVLATPMIWVWMADRIRRRKLDPFRRLRDPERNGKDASSSLPPYESRPVVDSIWARQEKYKTTKPARAVTSDQILGIDKASYLQRIVPQSGSLSLQHCRFFY
jgi:hypothetical protein